MGCCTSHVERRRDRRSLPCRSAARAVASKPSAQATRPVSGWTLRHATSPPHGGTVMQTRTLLMAATVGVVVGLTPARGTGQGTPQDYRRAEGLRARLEAS